MKYRQVNNPGAYRGPWKNSDAPPMVEPMDVLDSREFDACAFVGPAQSAKTDSLIVNWSLHSIVCDPMDLIIYNPTMQAARDFSVRRIDRLNRHSKAVGEKLIKRRDADNKFDKHYTNGMMLSISYPSVTEVAGKPIPHAAITDYDRIDDDIGGDGNAFDLIHQRTTTFGSFRMTVCESSPSKPILDPRWIPATPHEGPPATGIFAIYNRGDRRCWYWPCPHCGQYFQGLFEHLEWDDLGDPLPSSKTVRMRCPFLDCRQTIHPDERYEMQLWGRWLKDGQTIDSNGRIHGKGRQTSIASFWLRGVAAAFVSWQQLVEKKLLAEQEYERTQSEEALKKFHNNDLAEVYLPKALDSQRVPSDLKARAEKFHNSEDADLRVVPEGVRFLVANIDVQKNQFEVQVHGISPGVPFDIAVIDRFSVRKSNRTDGDGDIEWVKPATYLEDWELLIPQVLQKTYPLADGSGREMRIHKTTCDMGGFAKNKGESVTNMAYEFWRQLRRLGMGDLLRLTKGDPLPGVPRARTTYPDSSDKNKWSAARGDVPVLMLNANVLKDALHARLDCLAPGKGMIRFPDFLPEWFYQELCAELRTPKGWEKLPHAKNEAWDLLYYCIGVCVSQLINAEELKWNTPPSWAATWDKNHNVVQGGPAKIFAETPNRNYDFGGFAQSLA